MSSVFPPGVQLAARYRVLRVLESKPVGALFEAEQLDTRRRVALKWLRFGAGHAALAQQRAARVRAAISVRHPKIAVVHDVAHEGSSLFVVSDLLRGESLRARLAPHAMPLHERLRALADVGRAVAFAHKRGAVHGGLHPGNIFLHREHDDWVMLAPAVKVHDFGAATHTMPECLAHPAERCGLGAHAFLDHAQLCGAEPDAQSDIYAFAVLLFQALTGRVPFAAKSPIELAVTLATSPVPMVGDRHPGLPASLDALIHESLQHQRDERPKQLDPLAELVSAYAEALAARELLAARPHDHTLPLVQKRASPGPQVTRLLTLMGGDADARSDSRSCAVIAPAATPARPRCAGLNDEPVRSQRPDLAPTNRQPPALTYEVGCITLEVLPSDQLVEIPRPAETVAEPAEPSSRADPQHAGCVGVLDRERATSQRRPEPAPNAALLHGARRGRRRAWWAGSAVALALAGTSAALAISADLIDLSLGTRPAALRVLQAQPGLHGRHRHPMLVDAPARGARETSVDAPSDSARAPSTDAPADAPGDGARVEREPEQLARRAQAAGSLDDVSRPARSLSVEHVQPGRARERTEAVNNGQLENERDSHDILVDAPRSRDQL